MTSLKEGVERQVIEEVIERPSYQSTWALNMQKELEGAAGMVNGDGSSNWRQWEEEERNGGEINLREDRLIPERWEELLPHKRPKKVRTPIVIKNWFGEEIRVFRG